MRIFAIIAVALLAVACGGWNAPIPTTPVKGEPCGVIDHACVEQTSTGLKPTGFCCGQNEICGGGFPNVGCPAGVCCDDGDDDPTGPPEARRRHQTPQRKY